MNFPTNSEGILAAAVARLDQGKYVMSEDGLKALEAAIRPMFTVLGCEKTFVVQGEVGVSSYVCALLGHCSVASTKVSWMLLVGCSVEGGCRGHGDWTTHAGVGGGGCSMPGRTPV